jgi:undecaprenyl diphosphate synthase
MSKSAKAAQPLPVPRHVAIIMDGNGRWAKQRGLPRIKGHEQGAESVRAVLQGCRSAGVEYLTLYAFSVENWVRPPDEIGGLMRLLQLFLENHEHELHENQVRLRVIGRIRDLPALIRRRLEKVMAATEQYTSGTLVLALSYGGRAELVDAVKAIAQKAADGTLNPRRITEKTIAQHLYAPDIPDPDLMIRTSGEMRLSNFLLWQLSYAELYVTDVFWPDFREQQLLEAIEAYRHRHRRFGGVS